MKSFDRFQISLRHTDYETAADIYQHDDDCGDRVAFDELGRTVHRAEKVRFTLNFFAPDFCFRIVNRALIQIRVNSHLFTGHRVQSETRRNFRDTFRAFRDDDKIYYDEDYKHDETDNRVTSDDEISERGYNFAGVPVYQNQSR